MTAEWRYDMQPEAGLDNEAKDVWNGPCVGGPLDAQDGVSRFPLGFLLVDRPANQCWIYDWTDGQFVVREAAGTELVSDPDGDKNRYRAADEAEYDVIAAPWIDVAPTSEGDPEVDA
jgi:hypothetical protein